MPELYLLLMKMSLADETPSALAARHAIAGLSYQHLGQHKTAAMHQTKSLRALQTVIGRLAAGDLEATQALRAMAASMLLNIFEVRRNRTYTCETSTCWANMVSERP
jgi:hypothetical protein